MNLKHRATFFRFTATLARTKQGSDPDFWRIAMNASEMREQIPVLAEGPGSRIPEKARARKFPTKTLRGMVFIWMGEGVPVPIEEDVPPEFFYGKETLVFAEERLWPVNWRVALENALDSHVMYV